MGSLLNYSAEINICRITPHEINMCHIHSIPLISSGRYPSKKWNKFSLTRFVLYQSMLISSNHCIVFKLLTDQVIKAVLLLDWPVSNILDFSVHFLLLFLRTLAFSRESNQDFSNLSTHSMLPVTGDPFLTNWQHAQYHLFSITNGRWLQRKLIQGSVMDKYFDRINSLRQRKAFRLSLKCHYSCGFV